MGKLAVKGASSSSLLRIVAVAIAFVLALHWYLMLRLASPALLRRHTWLLDPAASGQEGGKDNQRPKRKGPYILSTVCGGCYRSYSGNVPCYDLVQKQQTQNNGTTLVDAFRSVGRSVPECKVCDPDTCHKRYIGSGGGEAGQRPNFKYWRYDRIAPQYTSASNLVLPSIPDRLRFPPSHFDHPVDYIQQLFKDPDPKNTSNAFLFEWNPSLAAIPTEMRTNFPPEARYVAVLRVTPYGRCFAREVEAALTVEIRQTMDSRGLLGIALLDSDYQVIRGYDAVIDMDVQLDVKRWKWMGEPAFSDYRVFQLNGELYLHCNADVVLITKLKLRAKGFGSDADEGVGSKNREQPIRLKNLHGGDELEVTLMHQFNSIWGTVKDAGDGKRWKNFEKNFALFSPPNKNIYAEMTVYPERIVRQIIPDEYEKQPLDKWMKMRHRRNFRSDKMVQRRAKTVKETKTSAMLLPSFFTVDEHWFPGKRNPYKDFFSHGGACCVSFYSEDIEAYPRNELEGVDSLLVGVGHNLIAQFAKNRLPENERDLVRDPEYVSFFYAFKPSPPFDLVARSGFFCLGFASASDKGPANPHSILTHNRPFVQHNETFDCPEVHFVSSIVEKADDSSTVVMGYGINDCTARLVEVAKSEVARILFSSALALE